MLLYQLAQQETKSWPVQSANATPPPYKSSRRAAAAPLRKHKQTIERKGSPVPILPLSKKSSPLSTTATETPAGEVKPATAMSSVGGGAAASASASGSFEHHAKRRLPAGPPPTPTPRKLLTLSVQGGDVAAGVVPPVTVVLDGRCICHRVHLTRHTGYLSLAGTLRRMFVDADDGQQRGCGGGGGGGDGDDLDLDLANAVPGHVVAYEDMEDDLLLAGDLKWNDFVRVAKRIRIIPAKTKSSRAKKCGAGVNNK